MEFAGFPAGAFSFYEQLRVDNSKAFWIAHKGEYEQYVLRPIIALGEELEEEFGVASVFRPYRDIRFSADKSPYKTYQGMFVERAPGLGFYAGISADGVLASGVSTVTPRIRSNATVRRSTPSPRAAPSPRSHPGLPPMASQWKATR
jgi:uncharacterized protein (DUF2461 family)